MAIPEALLQEEKAAEDAVRQAYTPTEGTPDSGESVPAAPVETSFHETQTDGGEWKHKYDVLKGKYDAELPRALDEARYWRDRCDQLQAQIGTLAETQPKTEPNPSAQELTDYLGEDAANIVARLLDQQKREMEEKFGQVANLSRQSAEQAFWTQVRAAFPNYGDMQHDPGINNWLAGTWPGQRQTRLQQADALAKALDADGFIALLQAYQPTAAPPRPAMPGPTPRRAAGSGTPPPAAKSISPAELESFGPRIMSLKNQGRYQEATALEREFDAAVREKRIGV